MKQLIGIGLMAIALCGAGCEGLNDCSGEVAGRDKRDVKVFLELSGAEESQFCESSSLRKQYDRWAAGQIGIDGNAAKTREAADSAAMMSAAAMGASMSRSSK